MLKLLNLHFRNLLQIYIENFSKVQNISFNSWCVHLDILANFYSKRIIIYMMVLNCIIMVC